MIEWKSYSVSFHGARDSGIVALIEERMLAARKRLECDMSHRRITLYGAMFCFDCGEWLPSLSDD